MICREFSLLALAGHGEAAHLAPALKLTLFAPARPLGKIHQMAAAGISILDIARAAD
jgi:hypothetical protein